MVEYKEKGRGNDEARKNNGLRRQLSLAWVGLISGVKRLSRQSYLLFSIMSPRAIQPAHP